MPEDDALRSVFENADQLQQIAAQAIGYRQAYIEAGVTSEVADQIMRDMHSVMVANAIDVVKKQQFERDLALADVHVRLEAIKRGVPYAGA